MSDRSRRVGSSGLRAWVGGRGGGGGAGGGQAVGRAPGRGVSPGLGVRLATANDYGSVKVDLDPQAGDINLDNTVTKPLDEYTPTISATYVFLAGVHLTAGPHVLQFTVVGTDPSSINNRYNSGIDFIEAVPVTGATNASFTAAMNNLGIATDGAASFAGNFDMTSNTLGHNLSLNSMQAAGITPGIATAAGASFTP